MRIETFRQLNDTAKAVVDDLSYATLATLTPDGQPQLSLVWITRDGGDVLISTLEGRRKYRNLLGDDRATVLAPQPGAPEHYVEIRGRVTISRDDGGALVDSLARKYTGKPYGSDGPDDVRVVLRLHPDHVVVRWP